MNKGIVTKIYGVLGYPAKHSLSPLMHNAALRFLNIKAEYKIFEKRPEELESFIRSLRKNNIYGFNVTVPYKEKIIPFLHRVSSDARLIGAVNTVRVLAGRMEGVNTDAEGFLKHLTCDLKFDPRGKTAALIGAGGAAKAVAVSLGKTKPRRVRLFDLDRAKAEKLISRLRKIFPATEFDLADSIEGLRIEEADLLVNATPQGMKKNDPLLVNSRLLRHKLLVYDLIYNPKQTKLLAAAKKAGAKISNGLGMLLYQGAKSFEYFTGRPAPIEIMRRAINRGARKLC